MSPQRRTALVSVLAAAGLVLVKLVTGLATGSLGLISEALHSAVDLVAALLTFLALSVSGRPADVSHPYGHGKAEHLSALAEAVVITVASLVIAGLAIARLTGAIETDVETPRYAFAVLGVVIAVDASRTAVSLRTARRYGSEALLANALHFGSDLAGSLAVLAGLALTSAGYTHADSVAALVVAALVLSAGSRLIQRNVDVLMDRAPEAAHETARAAIAALEPPVDLVRLRLRQAGGRHFADVVIGVSPGAAIGQAHAAADAVEDAVHDVLPGSDVVVHVEPQAAGPELRERAQAAALAVPRVREVHNITVLTVGDRTELSLHLKLPGDLRLEAAHAVANEVEQAIHAAIPGIEAVQTHLEPLADTESGEALADEAARVDAQTVGRIVREATGSDPRELRFLRTEHGVVVFLTLALDPEIPLADAHRRAGDVEERIRRERPGLAEVIVHTEP